MLVDGLSVDGLGKATEFRELLNDDRRLVMLKSRRTPDGFLMSDGEPSVADVIVIGSISFGSGVSISSSWSDDG